MSKTDNKNILPLVSVIIPSYNHGAYLKERIDSVLGQDYPNFEVIILDDCSPDNSKEIINSYKDREHVVHCIYNEQNSGNTFHQWEKGIAMANGDYIWIAESDDKANPRFISTLMDKLLQVPDAVLAFSHSIIIDADGKEILPNVWDGRSKFRNGGIYDAHFFGITRMLFYNAPYNASMVLFRKKYFKNVTPAYKSFRHNGDYQFWLEMSIQGKVIEVPEALNYFRQHDKKVSATGLDDAFLENCEIVDNAISLLQLNSYQQHCLKGKYIKRWKRSIASTKHLAKEKFPRVYGGNFFDVVIYTVDKIFNFSGMNA